MLVIEQKRQTFCCVFLVQVLRVSKRSHSQFGHAKLDSTSEREF